MRGPLPPNDVPDIRFLYTARRSVYALWTAIFRQQQAITALLKRSGVIPPGLRALDAGCGSGAATFALVSVLRERGAKYASIDGFDLTPAMLECFRARLVARHLENIHLKEADVLFLDVQLPESWANYDLIISASMLEYVPRSALPHALSALRGRLTQSGNLLAVITRKNLLSRVMIEWAWKAHAYTAEDLDIAFRSAGFSRISFRKFPFAYGWFNTTNYAVVAGN